MDVNGNPVAANVSNAAYEQEYIIHLIRVNNDNSLKTIRVEDDDVTPAVDEYYDNDYAGPGTILDGDLAAILAKDYPGGTIVTDSVTSDRLTAFLEEGLGLRHHRFKRGYKNVINESKRLNAEGIVSPLAIETSGPVVQKIVFA